MNDKESNRSYIANMTESMLNEIGNIEEKGSLELCGNAVQDFFYVAGK